MSDSARRIQNIFSYSIVCSFYWCAFKNVISNKSTISSWIYNKQLWWMDLILSAKCRCRAWPRVTGWSIPLTCHYLILSHVMFLLSLFAHALVHGLRPSWPSCMFLIFVPTLPVCSLTVSALLCQWSPGVCLCHQPQLPRCFKLKHKHWKHFSCIVLVQFMQLKTGPILPQSWY